jgi:hypothetical protein
MFRRRIQITWSQFVRAMVSVALPALCLFAGVPFLFVGLLGRGGYLADAGQAENVAIGLPYVVMSLGIFAATAAWFFLAGGVGRHETSNETRPPKDQPTLNRP